MSQKRFEIIYADPPWSYYNDMTVLPDVTTVSGVRRPPYPVMSSEDIKKLPVNDITHDNAVLLIWTTDYHLEKCLGIINAWGFTYKTIGFVWQKLNKSGSPVCFTGAYTLKSGCELCLLATKGNTKGWVVDKKIRALIQSQRQHHSKKPDEVRDKIVKLFGDRPRVELFARDVYEGWDRFGNQVESTVGL